MTQTVTQCGESQLVGDSDSVLTLGTLGLGGRDFSGWLRDAAAVFRGGYRISPRGGRPVMDWCLNAIE